MPGANYASGMFTVPGSTGSFAVTGVGFRPQVLLFFGSNQATEDAVVSGAEGSVFRGTMVADDTSDTLVSWCASMVPHSAMRWEQHPIVSCLDGDANTDYQASAVSMDADGFTVNFTVVSAGTRVVHWVAIGEMDNCTAGIHTSSTTLSLGWRPYSGLHLGGLDDTILDSCGPNRECADWGNMLTWGGKSFATDNDLNWHAMRGGYIDTPFNDQDAMALDALTGTPSYVGLEGHFLGPFLVTSPNQHTLSGVGLEDVTRTCGPDNQVHYTELDVHSTTGSVTPAADVDDVVNIDPNASNSEINVPALILFLGLSGRPAIQGQGNTNAITMGYWTEDSQGCWGANGVDDSFYQSAQRGWVSSASGSGAHAGRVDLADDGTTLDLTTEVAGIGPEVMVWHIFGPKEEGWIPQMYRWWKPPIG